MTYEPNLKDAREIWELLLEDKKIQIAFPEDGKELQYFRVRLHQIKASSYKNLVAIGFLAEDEVQSLLFEKVKTDSVLDKADLQTYEISLGKRKREANKYTIKIVE